MKWRCRWNEDANARWWEYKVILKQSKSILIGKMNKCEVTKAFCNQNQYDNAR